MEKTKMYKGYISKKKAFDELDYAYMHCADIDRYGLSTALDAIDKIETADVVQVVHAYWIQTSAEDEDGNAYYSCSNCGSRESHNPIVEVPYCWKCGAKMDAHGEE
jgi:hypothetical protein